MTEINYGRLAAEAGLVPQQIHHFVRGVVGDDSTAELLLERERYNRLQGLVEETESAVLLAKAEGAKPDEVPFHFHYLTERLLTPFYRPDHPRFDVVQRLFDAREAKPLACAVACMSGFTEQKTQLTPEQNALLTERLTHNLPKEGLSSIALTSRDWHVHAATELPVVNYLALPATDYRPVAMAFCASQGGPAGLSKGMGSVIFGPQAERMRTRVQIEWLTHAGRFGSRAILRLLEAS